MAGTPKSPWVALATQRWGWPVQGDGPLCVVDAFQEQIYLHMTPMEAQVCINAAPWRRKFYKLQLLKPLGAFTLKLPADKWEQ